MKRIKLEFPAPRRTAAAVLAAAMLCSPVWTGQASAAESGETTNFTASALTNAIPEGAKISSVAAASTAQKLFPELTPAKVTSVDYSAYYNESNASKTWRITYTLSSRDNGTASVSVDAVNGNVLDAYLPVSGENEAKVTREQASEQAESFLRRAMPDKKASDFVAEDLTSPAPAGYGGGRTLTPLFGSSSYSFSFRIKVNGVPSQSETAFVSIGASGSITGFSRSMNNLSYPSATPKVSEAEAQQSFESDFDMELSYVPVNGWGGSASRYYLGYVPHAASTVPIDASTGQKLDPTTGLAYASAIGAEGEALKNGSAFVPTPLKTEEAAQRQLEKLGLIPAGYKLTGQQTHTQDYPKKNTKVWMLDLNRMTKGSSGNINAQLNAETGQLYNYYSYEQNVSNNGDVQPTAANQSQAAAWASKLLPNAGEWRMISVPKSGDWVLNYTFQRYESGIPVAGDTASVTIDKAGTLKEYYFTAPSSGMKGTFPSADTVKISAADAKEKFLDEAELQLYYSRFDRSSGPSGEVDSVMKLTYVPMLKAGGQLGNFNILDASDGKWKTLYGFGIEQRPSTAASDIAGHKNEAALEKMVDHGVLIPDEAGNINPDARLTRAQWADMLARAMQPDYVSYNSYAGMSLFKDVEADSPDQSAIGFLVSQGWLKPDQSSNFRPEAELTRDELAQLLMGVLKYDKLASYYNSTVELPGIADAESIVNKGDAVLAIKLGLLPPINGSFLPEQVVTKADAAVVLLQLSELQGKTDTFMNWNSW
ncbi:YcdB/YcdC domain-containing protein [Saccharibacillus kuerlensis]|uniref:SLH domain-containing protein n=1 Tax=Saccharibacillus kuerlensis TaxID=459527 RepID=A0ABQ2L0G8_9BACL|nr:YcdB/YcdC domain-containing protein [Saccharibacillus kuerlensis]GGN98716.1 hypothetical protein GCM10010969_18130 [Saccharibacillus kuerlensis]